MAKHQDIGRQGEALAASYLAGLGWEILAQNWQANGQNLRSGELDFVAKDQAVIVFVEVKTRARPAAFGQPEDNLSPQKERKLLRSAAAYLRQMDLEESEIRFDLLAITLEPQDLKHYRDAFFPTW